MSTYTQAPAFQTYQTNPYQLPVQQIVQALAARNAYWDEGASRLKNSYQNYLNLDLGLKSNQDKLDKYMLDVNSNLRKVVSSDLSLAENVTDAMKIFDPIKNDEGIKYDNAFTKFIKGQTDIAQSYRNKDNGEGYNATNVTDMLQPYKDYVKADDPNKGRDAYSNRRYYTPYYDVAKEHRELYKEFKPNITDLTTPTTEEYIDKDGKKKTRLTQSGYLVQELNKSIVKKQYRAYLEANLSDKAKEQLKINGRVSYGDDLESLSTDYINYNNENINTYTDKIAELVGKKRVAENNHDVSTANEYDTQIKEYGEEIKKLKTTNSKLKIKDYTELSPIKEVVAARMYSDKWMDYISAASERLDITTKYSTDHTALTYFTQDQLNKNKNADRQLDWQITVFNANAELEKQRQKGIIDADLERLKTRLTKTKIDEGLDDTTPAYKTADLSDNENPGKKEIDNLETEGKNIKENASDILNKYLINIGVKKEYDPNLKVNGVVQTKEQQEAANEVAIKTWKEGDGKDDWHWKKYLQDFTLGDSKLATVKAINESVNEEMHRKFPEVEKAKEDYAEKIKTGATIWIDEYGKNSNPLKTKSLTLTRDQLRSIALGNNPNIQAFKVEDKPSTLLGGMPEIQPIHLKINGKEYLVHGGDQMGGDLLRGIANQKISNILTDIHNIDKEAEKTRTDLFNNAWTRIVGLQKFNTTSKESAKIKSLEDIFYGKIAGKTGVKSEDIIATGYDKSGGVYYKVNTTAGSAANTADLKLIKYIVGGVGGKYFKEYEGGTFWLPNSEVAEFITAKTFKDSRITSLDVEVAFKSKNKMNGDIWNTTPMIFNNIPFNFRVTQDNGKQVFEIIHEDSGAVFANTTGEPFDSLEEAASFAQTLSDLAPEDLLYKIRTQGKKSNYKL